MFHPCWPLPGNMRRHVAAAQGGTGKISSIEGYSDPMSVTVAAVGLGTEASLLRVHIDTAPDAAAEDLHRVIGAVLDEVALAYALLSPNVRRTPPLWRDPVDRTFFNGSGARLETATRMVRLAPAYQVIPQVRSDVLRIHKMSYSNPLEIVIGLVGAGAALYASMAKFIDTVNLLEASRKLAEAGVDKTIAETQLADATAERTYAEADQIRIQNHHLIERGPLETRMIELSIKEKELLLETAMLELSLKKRQIAEEIAEAERLAAGMTQSAAEARRQILPNLSRTGDSSRWPEAHIGELFENTRLIGSVEVGAELKPRIEVVHEYDI